MTTHVPHEIYLSLLISRRWEDAEIEDEFDLLRLPKPDEDLLERLRATVPVIKNRRFTPTNQLRRWADRRNLSRGLLNANSKRVQAARAICFHSQIRHTLELCLLNPRMSWEDIIGKLSLLGKPKGVMRQMVEDYQQLFWNFAILTVKEKERYFRAIGATVGMQAAADGYPIVGLSLDFGVPNPMSDEERLAYMRDVALMRYSKDMHSGRANAQDARNWVSTVLVLDNELRRVAPPEVEPSVVFDGGVIDMIPSVDHLDFLEEEDERRLLEEEDDTTNRGQLIPFVPKQ